MNYCKTNRLTFDIDSAQYERNALKELIKENSYDFEVNKRTNPKPLYKDE